MKQFAYIYLITYFFIAGMMTNGDIHEFLKVSNLIEHFKEHLSSEPAATIPGLFAMHYGSDGKTSKHHQEDHDKHSGNLPFQSHNCCHASAVYVVNLFNSIDFDLFASNTTMFSFYLTQFPPQISGSIWQPPQSRV